MLMRRGVLLTLILVLGVSVIYAQADSDVRSSYYLKADTKGVQQVYQQPPLESQGQVSQITQAASDVVTYGIANDGASLTYISAGQLWVQSIGKADAEALVPVNATAFYRAPVYNGQYIAYSDSGVWLVDLNTRKTRQILKDVGAGADGGNAADFRIYQPEEFVPDMTGKITQLIVDVGVWEWNTVGVYDLASGDFNMLEGQVHTDLLRLGDGKVLLYGNGGIGGEQALHMADSLDNLNANSKVLDFSMLGDKVLFADQAVEIVPTVVRIFGQTIPTNASEVQAFYFDFDVQAYQVVTPVKLVTLSDEPSGETLAGPLSPDGKLLPVYHNATVNDAGVTYGDFKILDLTTNKNVLSDGEIGLFDWQQGYLGP